MEEGGGNVWHEVCGVFKLKYFHFQNRHTLTHVASRFSMHIKHTYIRFTITLVSSFTLPPLAYF